MTYLKHWDNVRFLHIWDLESISISCALSGKYWYHTTLLHVDILSNLGFDINIRRYQMQEHFIIGLKIFDLLGDWNIFISIIEFNEYLHVICFGPYHAHCVKIKITFIFMVFKYHLLWIKWERLCRLVNVRPWILSWRGYSLIHRVASPQWWPSAGCFVCWVVVKGQVFVAQ